MHRRVLVRACRILIALLILAPFLPTAISRAQIEDQATLTVLRGQVAVVRPNGSALQPAPSGTTVRVGDQIRTLTSTGALITFFTGTEIEMGEDTVLEIERVSRQGDRVDVSLKQVAGVTLNRVATFTDPGSSYRINAGGAVALVRGTRFVLEGPTNEGIVVFICLGPNQFPNDQAGNTTPGGGGCDNRTTFAGRPVSNLTGYYVTVARGVVTSGVRSFKPDFSGGPFGAAAEGATLASQELQGDTEGVPPGQVPQGQQQEIESGIRNEEPEEENVGPSVTPTATRVGQVGRPTAGPTVTPTQTVIAQPCNNSTNSGGPGVTETFHELGKTGGSFQFSYDAFSVPDQFDIFYQGNRIFTTGGPVSGANTVNVTYGPGTDTKIMVRVTGPSGTAWTYTVFCPA